jgi:hypothetical protein
MIFLLRDGLFHPRPGDDRHQSSRRVRYRRALQHIGMPPILGLGFLLELGWAFVGSLGLGLGVAASGAGPLQAFAWLGGTLAVAGATAGAALLARPDEERRKED